MAIVAHSHWSFGTRHFRLLIRTITTEYQATIAAMMLKNTKIRGGGILGSLQWSTLRIVMEKPLPQFVQFTTSASSTHLRPKIFEMSI